MDLAQARGTAVIMTIHQPRANIFARFDRLLLICKGESVYYGPARDVHQYFGSIGRPIPPAYNPADYLIDILFTHNDPVVPSDKKMDGRVVENPLALCDEEGGLPVAGGAGETLGGGGAKPMASLAELFAESYYGRQALREVEAQIK